MTEILMPDWVSMDIGDLGKSIYNDHPLDDDTRPLKKKAIVEALVEDNRELLAALSRSRGGLLNSELRFQVWSALLGVSSLADDATIRESVMFNSALMDSDLTHVDEFEAATQKEAEGAEEPTDEEKSDRASYEKMLPHKDENQVKLDVDRSFIFYPANPLTEDLLHMRSDLTQLITRILRTNPFLHYYQGYHDIVSIIYLVFRDYDPLLSQTYAVLEHLTLNHLRDFMIRDIQPSIDQLMLLPELVARIDPKFGQTIGRIQPFYALSSILTMFSHDVTKFEDICMIMDFIMATGEASSSIYIFAAVLFYHKSDIMRGEAEMDTLHSELSRLFVGLETGDLFSVLLHANLLAVQFPLLDLSAFQDGISQYSVLKTTSRGGFEAECESETEDVEQPLRRRNNPSLEASDSDIASSLTSSISSLQTTSSKSSTSETGKAHTPYATWKDRIEALTEKLGSEVEAKKQEQEQERLKQSAALPEKKIVRRKLKLSLLVKLSLTVGILSFVIHYYKDVLPLGVTQTVTFISNRLAQLRGPLVFERTGRVAGGILNRVGLGNLKEFRF
ncbi:hypothetical protein BABINDRAFT_160294 [Babjeviella inositovora NRRL Y-12698]|uniref:Rab-GAP TBC domain-containing protein n=1 Tax=Babjeviella inositovora NRRL Y-12698 TaxID=984486 RepID=A0A1E3QWN6_9ASCO|nr:uncharacterized protein BABINDRAFT_160294 [Babjeviella inositovora NRRL Y-12698]ODQ82098.1 hypothetical protein BABINDRAFT_160294 [Babjeviella inositovora NRRL Y-12698]